MESPYKLRDPFPTYKKGVFRGGPAALAEKPAYREHPNDKSIIDQSGTIPPKPNIYRLDRIYSV